MKFHNVLARIGNTPIIKLRSVKVKSSVEIWGKLEALNPGGSIKDRIALSMIEDAEKKGILTRDKIVIEASSGNTGIGLSLVCAVKGYKCIIAMSESASIERRKIMQAFGADILLTPAEKGTDGAIETVYELLRENPEKYFCPDQYNNPANWMSHYRTTAPEIWKDTEGKVTHVVCGLGTTGTAMGIAKFSKDRGGIFKVIGVEPVAGHKIQGLKNMKESYPPGIYDKKLLDQIINVNDEEAFYWCRKLAREEGIFVGMSSGAALAGAIKLAENLDKGFIVVIFPDGGERYLSTPLWSFSPLQEQTDLVLTNTFSEKKEPFKPIKTSEVKIYTCGPTLNVKPHIGLYRRFLTVDILKNFLKLKGYKVFHVVNLTDYDDKTIKTAIEKEKSLKDLTAEIEKEFFKDLKLLKIDPADVYPKVSDHLEDMKNLALKILEEGKGYVKYSTLYFDISRFSEYGKLSKIDLNSLKPGATIDLEDYDKEEPYDFALLKRVHLLELKKGYYIETNFGKVRPTWHIHCATLCLKYLGENFDIYTSSCDLIFPHHENTRAVAKALTGKEPANYWIHTALVYYKGKKLSSENKITLTDIIKNGFSPLELRLYFLRTHYRNPFNFTWKGLEESKKILKKLSKYIALLLTTSEKNESRNENFWQILEEFRKNWKNALKEDLNTPKAISCLITFFKKIYPGFYNKFPQGFKKAVLNELRDFNKVLKFLKFPEEIKKEEVLLRVKERDKARKEGNFELADKIRKELQEKGYLVIDTPYGTKVFEIKEEE